MVTIKDFSPPLQNECIAVLFFEDKLPSKVSTIGTIIVFFLFLILFLGSLGVLGNMVLSVLNWINVHPLIPFSYLIITLIALGRVFVIKERIEDINFMKEQKIIYTESGLVNKSGHEILGIGTKFGLHDDKLQINADAYLISQRFRSRPELLYNFLQEKIKEWLRRKQIKEWYNSNLSLEALADDMRFDFLFFKFKRNLKIYRSASDNFIINKRLDIIIKNEEFQNFRKMVVNYYRVNDNSLPLKTHNDFDEELNKILKNIVDKFIVNNHNLNFYSHQYFAWDSNRADIRRYLEGDGLESL